ncbi:hypothetical protein AOLI_G00135430 [Acnodon oligacanthus]
MGLQCPVTERKPKGKNACPLICPLPTARTSSHQQAQTTDAPEVCHHCLGFQTQTLTYGRKPTSPPSCSAHGGNRTGQDSITTPDPPPLQTAPFLLTPSVESPSLLPTPQSATPPWRSTDSELISPLPLSRRWHTLLALSPAAPQT